jgi:hypothetical protein
MFVSLELGGRAGPYGRELIGMDAPCVVPVLVPVPVRPDWLVRPAFTVYVHTSCIFSIPNSELKVDGDGDGDSGGKLSRMYCEYVTYAHICT